MKLSEMIMHHSCPFKCEPTLFNGLSMNLHFTFRIDIFVHYQPQNLAENEILQDNIIRITKCHIYIRQIMHKKYNMTSTKEVVF